MSLYFLAIIVLSILMTVIGLLLNKRKLLIFLIILSVLIGWYIQVISTEAFNELAWKEFTEGERLNEPSDGASNVFALLFGWVPSLTMSAILIGFHKLVKLRQAYNIKYRNG